MRKPIIGIIGNTRMSDPGLFISGEYILAGCPNVNAVLRNGGIPVIIPAAVVREDTEGALSCCDGILFPGGEDLDPAYYGEDPLPCIGVFKPEMDEALFKAGKYALMHDLPMMGICKGMQFLNVLMGGSLYQDLSLHGGHVLQHLQKHNRTYLTHNVKIEENCRLARTLGAGVHRTNSMHHQAVKELGKGLRIVAHAADGVIEAFEDEAGEGKIMGIQWHPEDLIDSAPEMNKLFRDFIEQCEKKMK